MLMMYNGYRPPKEPLPPEEEGEGTRRILWHRVFGALLVVVALAAGIVLLVRFVDYRMAQLEYAGYADITDEAEAEAVPPLSPVLTESPSPAPTAPTTPATTARAAVVPIITASPVPTDTPVPTPEPFFSDRVRKLIRQNSDTIGFIDVQGTDVQYPVVQTKDNDYYMTHTFAKKRRAAGAIFLDTWNRPTLEDFNSIIYGHNMKDGSMFALLREYRHAEFLREHKYIQVTLLNSQKTYKVFSAYIADDDFDFRGFTSATDGEKAAFLKRITYRSEIDTNAEATTADRILTLVTCTSGERDRYWVVHAVLVTDVTAKE